MFVFTTIARAFAAREGGQHVLPRFRFETGPFERLFMPVYAITMPGKHFAAAAQSSFRESFALTICIYAVNTCAPLKHVHGARRGVLVPTTSRLWDE